MWGKGDQGVSSISGWNPPAKHAVYAPAAVGLLLGSARQRAPLPCRGHTAGSGATSRPRKNWGRGRDREARIKEQGSKPNQRSTSRFVPPLSLRSGTTIYRRLVPGADSPC